MLELVLSTTRTVSTTIGFTTDVLPLTLCIIKDSQIMLISLQNYVRMRHAVPLRPNGLCVIEGHPKPQTWSLVNSIDLGFKVLQKNL